MWVDLLVGFVGALPLLALMAWFVRNPPAVNQVFPRTLIATVSSIVVLTATIAVSVGISNVQERGAGLALPIILFAAAAQLTGMRVSEG